MTLKITLTSLILMISSLVEAKIFEGIKMEDNRVVNGVSLHTAKIDDLRIFHSEQERVINSKIDAVVSEVLLFQDRCNNDHRDKRRYLPKNFNCKHHNQNLVESFIVRY